MPQVRLLYYAASKKHHLCSRLQEKANRGCCVPRGSTPSLLQTCADHGEASEPAAKRARTSSAEARPSEPQPLVSKLEEVAWWHYTCSMPLSKVLQQAFLREQCSDPRRTVAAVVHGFRHDAGRPHMHLQICLLSCATSEAQGTACLMKQTAVCTLAYWQDCVSLR